MPTGYAVNYFGSNIVAGVMFGNDTQTAHNSAIAINSGGGDITVKGKLTSLNGGTSYYGAVTAFQGLSMYAGTSGSITMDGISTLSSGSHSLGVDLAYNRGTGYTATSILQTVNGNISITGTASGGTTDNQGFTIIGNGTNRNSIVASGTGTITLSGLASGTSPYGAIITSIDILAASGGITIAAQGTNGIISGATNGVYIGSKTGSAVTSSSSNITLTADSLAFGATMTASSAGTLTIQPYSTSFTSALTYSLSNLTVSAGLTGLTLGKVGNTAGITVSTAQSIAGPINIYGGDITINAGLTATGTNTIMLKGSGNVTDGASGYVSASNLLLSGGAVTLDNASNAIGTLAASGVSSLAYTDSNALTIGTVGATSGIGATGAVNIGTLTGDLSIAQNITTTDTTASALILNAGKNAAAGTSTGGNITISGSPTISVGTGGTAKLYTGSVSGSTGLTTLVGSGTGRFRYNSDETATNYTTALAANVINAIYREAFSVSGTISSETITYGDSTPSFSISGSSGMQNGDSSSGLTITSALYSTANKLKVGTYSVTASGLSGLGYSVGSVNNGSLVVGQKSLTVSGITASDKVYDGTTTATLGGTAAITAIGSDVVTLGGTAAGVFANKNIGTAKPITITGNTISGTDAANYTLVQQSGLTANITAKAITITADALSKTYGNADPSLAHTDSVALASGDSFTGSLSRATGENVGSYAISRNSLAISDGNSGNNYSITYASNNLSITQRAITLAATVATKVYGSADPALAVSVSAGSLASTTVTDTLADVTGTITRQSGGDVGSYNILLGSGTKAANYNITYNTSNAAFSITAKQLTLAGSTGVTKTYDGTTSMPTGTNGYGSLVGIVSGDTVSVTGAPVYNSKDVATATTINQGSVLLSGAQAGNYTLAWTNGSGTITPASLTVTANNDAKFVTQADTVGYTGVRYSGFVAGETSGTAGLTGTLAIARSNSGVHTAGDYILTPSGLSASNYNISYATGSYQILASDKLLVRVDGDGATTSLNTTYGTATNYALTSVEYYNGAAVVRLDNGSVGGSSVSINASNLVSVADGAGGSATFTLAPQGATTSTAGFVKAGAYSLATSGTVTENSVNFSDNIVIVGSHTIAQKSLTASAAGGVSKTYDGTASMSGVSIGLTGKETNDVVTVSGNGAFSDKNAATGNKSYTISGLVLAGADYANYYLSGGNSFTGNNGTISKADLTVAGLSASNKVYDAGVTATLTGAAYITALSGDTVTIGGTAAGAFANKNVGTAKSITVSGVTIGGADAGNYNLIQQTGLTADITKANLSVTGLSASNKVYDTTLTAALTGTAAVTALGSDVVTVGGTATGVFANKDVGTGKSVTVSGITITGGADAGNYNIVQQSGLTADITKANLTVTGLSASNKVYDATTAATLTGTATVTAIGSDVVTVGGGASGVFANANVGTGKSITVSGVTISGTDANNYNIVQQSGLTADVTKATLTVRANNDAKFVTTSDAGGYTGVSYSGFVGGETSTVLGGTLAIARSNAGVETAGTYSGVLVASGLTAGNYQFSYVGGDYTIVASNQLLVRANNASATYGSTPSYTVSSAKYWDPSANSGTGGEVALASVTSNGSNNFTINDGVGGSATFTLAPQSAVYSSANKVKVGTYQLGTSGTVSENSANFSDTITVVGSLQVNTKGLTASTATGISKTYDGTTTVNDVSMTLTGLESGDKVLAGGSGAFASSSVGTNLSYTLSNLTLRDVDAGNYYLTGGTSFSGSNGTINAAPSSGGGGGGNGGSGSTTTTDSGTTDKNKKKDVINNNPVLPPVLPVIPPPPLPAPSPNVLPAVVTTTTMPAALPAVAPAANQNTNQNINQNANQAPASSATATSGQGSQGGGQANMQAQSSNDKASFEGIKVGATSVGGDVKAIIIQSSSTSQTPVTLLVTIKPNEGFNFTVPQAVVAQAVRASVEGGAKAEVVSVALSDGKQLPAWLTFDKDNVNFKSENVPAGGLPLSVKLLVRNNDVTKTVEIVIRGNGK